MQSNLPVPPRSLETIAERKSPIEPRTTTPATAPGQRIASDLAAEPQLTPVLTLLAPETRASLSPGIDELEFLSGIRAFRELDRTTSAFIEHGIPHFVNSFWSSSTTGRHPLHGYPYRASFSPHLAAFFIERLSKAGDIVHDPFLGSGTTVLQAVLMGRVGFGSDINPYSLLITRPRLNLGITLEAVLDRLALIDWSHGDLGRDDLGAFFHPETARKIGALRRDLGIDAPFDAQPRDPIVDWIRMTVMARLTGHSAGFMSGYTLPPNLMMSIERQERSNATHGRVPPERDVAAIIEAKSGSLLRDGPVPRTAVHRLGVNLAWDTPWIADASVDLVLTSPPFANVVDYAKENWMKLWFAGIDPGDIAFSHFASLDEWRAMIRETLIEMMRIVKPGGYIAMEVGEVRRRTVDLATHVWAAAEGLPCRRLGVVIHAAKFTKSSHIFGVENGKRGTNTNRVIIMQRQ